LRLLCGGPQSQIQHKSTPYTKHHPIVKCFKNNKITNAYITNTLKIYLEVAMVSQK